MKRANSFACIGLSFLAFTGIASAQVSDTASTAQTAEAQTSMTDEQIRSAVAVANQGEIDQAKLALKQGKDKSVKEFANMMVKDHRDVKKELDSLGKSAKMKDADSSVKTSFEAAGKSSLTKLKALKGADFDKAYAEDQVAMHQTLLTSLDNELIPNAKNEKLKALLEKVKPSVAAHLEKAKDISSKLGSAM